LLFLICAGGDFFKNGKDIFLFRVLPWKFPGSVAGLQCGLGFAKTIFWGLDFRKTETNLYLHSARTEEGSGEESARASFLGGLGFPIFDNQMSAFHLYFQFLSFFPSQFTNIFNRQSYGKTVASGNFGKFSNVMIL